MKTSAVFILFLLVFSISTPSFSTNELEGDTPRAPLGINVSVNVNALMCNRTTDSGQDEIFFVVAGKGPLGNIQSRVPNTGHHSRNDSGGNPEQLLTNINLWTGTLETGQTVELDVWFMDEDDSPNPAALKAATDAISKGTDTSDPYVGTIVTVAKLLVGGWKNEDDLVGSLAFRVTNDNGTIKVTAVPKEYAKLTSSAGLPKFDLDHDDGLYDVQISVKASGNEVKWDSKANGSSN